MSDKVRMVKLEAGLLARCAWCGSLIPAEGHYTHTPLHGDEIGWRAEAKLHTPDCCWIANGAFYVPVGSLGSKAA